MSYSSLSLPLSVSVSLSLSLSLSVLSVSANTVINSLYSVTTNEYNNHTSNTPGVNNIDRERESEREREREGDDDCKNKHIITHDNHCFRLMII